MKFRLRASTAFAILILASAWAPAEPADRSVRDLFEEGVAAYKAVDLGAAEHALADAAEALRSEQESEPKARRLAAQVFLYRGRVAVVADRPEAAREHFREALRLDAGLAVSAETDPPKILRLFEAVRAERSGEPALTPAGGASPAIPAEAKVALDQARAGREAGVAAYRALDLQVADTRLQQASKTLAPFEARSPGARELAAKIFLDRGRVAAVAGRVDEARAQFAEALTRSPAIALDAQVDPPKLLELFDRVRSERQQVTRAEVPWWKLRWVGLGGAALVLLLALLLVRRWGQGRKHARSFAGNWSLTTVLVANNAGAPNGVTNVEKVQVRQNGAELSLVGERDRELFSATVQGRAISFGGSVLDDEAGKTFTRAYSGQGTVAPRLIQGSLTMVVTRDVQTHGFQFQSMSRYDYNMTMTRL
jgi:tetratricopeptide (TPR) repeat protein